MDSRPAANITWLLDDSPIHGGEVTYIPGNEDEWVEPYENQTVNQKLTLRLSRSEHGKKLSCQTHHLTWDKPINSYVAKINFPELPSRVPSGVSQIITQSTTATTTATTQVQSAEALYIVIAVLALSLIAVIVTVLIYAKLKSVFCFSRSAQSRVMAQKGGNIYTNSDYAEIAEPVHQRPKENLPTSSAETVCVDRLSSRSEPDYEEINENWESPAGPGKVSNCPATLICVDRLSSRSEPDYEEINENCGSPAGPGKVSHCPATLVCVDRLSSRSEPDYEEINETYGSPAGPVCVDRLNSRSEPDHEEINENYGRPAGPVKTSHCPATLAVSAKQVAVEEDGYTEISKSPTSTTSPIFICTSPNCHTTEGGSSEEEILRNSLYQGYVNNSVK